MNDRPHYVYRCYDDAGVLLYVGMTYNPPARMRQHAKKAPWYDKASSVRMLVFPNREYAAEKEREAIVLEQPIHNKTHLHWSPEQVGHASRELSDVQAAAVQSALDDWFERVSRSA